MKKHRLVLFFLLLSLTLFACNEKPKNEIINPPETVDKVEDKDDDEKVDEIKDEKKEEVEKDGVDDQKTVQQDIELVGPGNSPANWIGEGPLAIYEGYVYYIDRMGLGNLARFDIENSKDEVFKEGYFNNINISGDYIFVYGHPIDDDDAPYGIYMYGLKDDTSSFTDIGDYYPQRVLLYDDYFYFDSEAGKILRIKYNTSKIEPLIDMYYVPEFVIFDDKIYLQGYGEDDDYLSIYEADLDGNNLKILIAEVDLGLNIANNHIFFADPKSTTYNMHSFNIETKEQKHIADIWMYFITSFDDETYYWSHGKKMDKSDQGIFVADANGENPRLLFNHSKGISFYMADGYIFQYENEGENRLVMIDLNGDVIKILTRFKHE